MKYLLLAALLIAAFFALGRSTDISQKSDRELCEDIARSARVYGSSWRTEAPQCTKFMLP